MSDSKVKYASLSDEHLATLKVLEKELGVTLLALEPDNLPVAKLDPSQLKKLQATEGKLGVVLLAYKTKG